MILKQALKSYLHHSKSDFLGVQELSPVFYNIILLKICTVSGRRLVVTRSSLGNEIEAANVYGEIAGKSLRAKVTVLRPKVKWP